VFGFWDNQPQWNPSERGVEKGEITLRIKKALKILERLKWGRQERGKKLAAIVKMRFLEDKSYKQIGKDLGLCRSEVNRLGQIALERLYPIVRQLGLDETYFDNMGIV